MGASLETCRRRYQRLRDSLATLGPAVPGTLALRRRACGRGCFCRIYPTRLHGPYYSLSLKIRGKTASKRLTAAQAAVYAEFARNNRRLAKIVALMRLVGLRIAALLAAEAEAAVQARPRRARSVPGPNAPLYDDRVAFGLLRKSPKRPRRIGKRYHTAAPRL